MEYIQILGKNEVNYFHTLTAEERKLRITNIVQYAPALYHYYLSARGAFGTD